jgi:hypothetical protein
MAARRGFGIGRAGPPDTKGTRTCASIRISPARATCWCSTTDAPLTSCGAGQDLEHVVHARGLEEFDGHRAHHEGEAGRLAFGGLEHRAVVRADQPQIVARKLGGDEGGETNQSGTAADKSD